MTKAETRRRLYEDLVEQLQDLSRADPDIQEWFDRWGEWFAQCAVYGVRTSYPRGTMHSQLAAADKKVRQAYDDMVQEYVLRLGERPPKFVLTYS